MNVTLIDYTGKGNPDPDYAAKLLVYTKHTRLEQGQETRDVINAMSKEKLAEELDYISKTLRSSWEFVDYTFEIKGVTRAFTHQFVRTRTGTYAQQAQRVVDMSGFKATMPDTVAKDPRAARLWQETMDIIKSTYAELHESCSIPAQDCRGVLPTNVHTNIIAKFNLRTLADLCGKRDNPRAQGEYTDVIRGVVACMLTVHPWVHPFLYPVRTATPALDALLRKLLGNSSPVDLPELNKALKEVDTLKGIWG